MNRFTPDLSLGVACRNRQDDLVLSAHPMSTVRIPHRTRTPYATGRALHSCLMSVDPIGVASTQDSELQDVPDTASHHRRCMLILRDDDVVE